MQLVLLVPLGPIVLIVLSGFVVPSGGEQSPQRCLTVFWEMGTVPHAILCVSPPAVENQQVDNLIIPLTWNRKTALSLVKLLHVSCCR